MIKTSKKSSLHEQIRSEIQDRIFSNTWPPGSRIPVEHELMRQFDCSRMTVNKAVSSLVDAGFLERRKKAGTFVIYPSSHNASLLIPDIRKAVLDAGHPYHHRLVHREQRVATVEDQRLLKLKERDSILEVLTLHYASDRCFAFERRQINLETTPDAADVDFSRVPPSVWLLTHVPWSNAEHSIEAVELEPTVAEMMMVSAGKAGLKLSRRTWVKAGTITHADQYFVAGTLTLRASFVVKQD